MNISPPMFPGEHHESDFEQKDNPFDWKNLKAACVGTAPHHPAYEMTFEEYAKRRSEYVDSDGHPMIQLGFRVPDYHAFVLPAFSRRRNSQTGGSLYRYMTLTIEKGLIALQQDYHDLYTAINSSTDAIAIQNTEDHQRYVWACETLNAHKINLGTSSRTNTLYSPGVASWLGDAVKQVCGDMKMTQSDLTVVCMSMGIIEESETLPLPSSALTEFQKLIDKFDFCITNKAKSIGISKENLSTGRTEKERILRT